MICGNWSCVISGIAGAGVLLSPAWCIVMVFLRVPLGYSVSSHIAGDVGSGVVGLAGLDSPRVWSRASPSSDTVMLLSVRSLSPSLSFGNAVLSYS